MQRQQSVSPGAHPGKGGNLVFHTSASHGWQGRDMLLKRKRVPATRAPPVIKMRLVKVKAAINGPGGLVIAGARNGGSREAQGFYTIEKDKTFEKEFSSPRKLTLNGYSKVGGNIEISSSGTKSIDKSQWTENLEGMARSFGPGLQSKRAKWTVEGKTWPYNNGKIVSPAPNDEPNQARRLTGIVKTAAHEAGGRVDAIGWTNGYGIIDTVISNSSSHSPPESPSNLHQQYPSYYD